MANRPCIDTEAGERAQQGKVRERETWENRVAAEPPKATAALPASGSRVSTPHSTRRGIEGP